MRRKQDKVCQDYIHNGSSTDQLVLLKLQDEEKLTHQCVRKRAYLSGFTQQVCHNGEKNTGTLTWSCGQRDLLNCSLTMSSFAKLLEATT